jgi:hypothetical protein
MTFPGRPGGSSHARPDVNPTADETIPLLALHLPSARPERASVGAGRDRHPADIVSEGSGVRLEVLKGGEGGFKAPGSEGVFSVLMELT